MTNSVCSDFFFTMIRPDRKFSHLNAFEVLDTIVNCDLPSGHHLPLPRRRLPLLEVEIVEETELEDTGEIPAVRDPA